MFRFCTLSIQCKVFGSIWTLKHHTVLDLLHQQLQEVLPDGVTVQGAAGKWVPAAIFEAAHRDRNVSKAVNHTEAPVDGGLITWHSDCGWGQSHSFSPAPLQQLELGPWPPPLVHWGGGAERPTPAGSLSKMWTLHVMLVWNRGGGVILEVTANQI